MKKLNFRIQEKSGSFIKIQIINEFYYGVVWTNNSGKVGIDC